MAVTVRRVEYFYATVRGEPDEAFEILNHLAGQGVNLLALNTMPLGPDATQLTLFPESAARLHDAARASGLTLEGPHAALLVQGEDELGIVARLHARLHRGGVDVYASNAVTDGHGYYGYVLYLRSEDADRALALLRD
ncbi:MAG TPA: hypothetical protein VMH61_06790 [Candidatus Acidoferrales bacterium]|nr:hypothetical protein [Candidatus Acidoferrales bacterium]